MAAARCTRCIVPSAGGPFGLASGAQDQSRRDVPSHRVRALGQAASGFGPNGAGRLSAARVPGDSHRDLRNSRRHRIAGAAICALAAIGLTLLLIAVLPANVRAAREGITIGGKPPTPLVARSLIQGIFLTATIAAAILA